jgi:Rod binding domain-containing protein
MVCWLGTHPAMLIGMNNLGIQSSQTLSLLEETQGIKRTSSVGAAKGGAEIDAASKDFAAVMVTQLLNIMFESIEVDPNFGGGHGEEAWRSVLLDEYGKKIGDAGGFGLADMVKAQLLKNQELGG